MYLKVGCREREESSLTSVGVCDSDGCSFMTTTAETLVVAGLGAYVGTVRVTWR